MDTENLAEANSLLRKKIKNVEESTFSLFQEKMKQLSKENERLTSYLADAKTEVEDLRNLLWQYQTGKAKPRINK